MSFLSSLFVFLFGDPTLNSLIPVEEMEELKMLSQLDGKEINRVYGVFMSVSNHTGNLSKDAFLQLDCIKHNPFQDKLAIIFGYSSEKQAISFKEFIAALAIFNSSKLRDQKMKVAFRIQDIDDDGVISKADLKAYIQRCTEKDVDEEEDDTAHPEKSDFDDEKIDEVVGHVFDECSADGDNITFTDFQRIVGPTDYNTKLFLNV